MKNLQYRLNLAQILLKSGIGMLLILGFTSLRAQTNITTTIGSFNSSTCAVGDTIVLPITVNMASGISTAAISMAIDYDTTKLRCISSVTNLNTNIATGFLSNCGFFTNQSSNPPFTASSRRQFRAAWFNLVPVAFNGLMFNLRFVVVATGNSSVKWDVATPGNCEYADELAEVIPNCSFVDGSITCGSAAPVCGITLTSSAGTNAQTVIRNTAISNITYSTVAATGATVTGLPAGVTGTWASNTVTISGTPTETGTYNYIVTLSGCTGGISTASGSITVNPAGPNISTTIGSVSGCVGDTVTVPVTVTMAPGISTAAISMAIGYNASKLQCFSAVTSLNPLITSNFISNCAPIGNTNQFRAAWYNLVPVAFNGLMFNIRFVILDTGTYTLSWDLGTPGNCEYADEVADVIPNTVWNNGAVSTFPGCPVPCPPLSVSISPNGPTTFCQGGSVELNAVPVAFLATYQWLKDGDVLQGATNSTYTANLPGSYQVRLVLSNALNCSTVSPATLVNVTIPPSAGTLSGQQEICSASSVLFSSTVSGGTWSSSATGVATVNASSGVVTGVAAGTATITYTVTGTGGCANATASRTVTVSTPVSAGVLSGNQSVCVGSTTIFTSTTSGGSWSSSNTNIASVNSLTGEVTGVSAGTAQIVYTVMGTGGCSDTTATRSVNVSSCVPNLITNIGNVTGCVGDTVEVPVTVQMAAGISVAAISLAIDYDISKLQCLNTVSLLNPNIASGFLSNCGIFSNQNPNPPYLNSTREQFRAAWFNLVPVAFNGVMFKLRFVVLAGGSSSLQWDINTLGNCEYADELAEVIPNTVWGNGAVDAIVNCCTLQAVVTANGPTVLCQGSTVELNANQGQGYLYQWTKDGVDIAGATSSSYYSTESGLFAVIIRESPTCSSAANPIQVVVNPIPTVQISSVGSPGICPGRSLILNAVSTTATVYQWSLNGATIAGANGSSFAASVPGEYTVTVGDMNGCSGLSNNFQVYYDTNCVITTLGSVGGCRGDIVAVPVSVFNASNISAISMAINYNPNDLECIGLDAPSLLIANNVISNCGVFGSLHQFRIGWSSVVPVNLSGNLFNVLFRIKRAGAHQLTWDLTNTGNCEYADANANVISNTGWLDASNTATAGVISDAGSVNITMNPSSSTVSSLGSVSFVVSAFNANSYAWQRRVVGGSYQSLSDGALYSGSNSNQLTVNALTMALDQSSFRCIVSGICGLPDTSLAATLTIIPGTPGQISIDTVYACPGNVAQVYSVPVRLSNFQNIASITGRIDFNLAMTFVGITDIHPAFSQLIYGVQGGNRLAFSGFRSTGISIAGSEILFRMNFRDIVPTALLWDSSFTTVFDEYNGPVMFNTMDGAVAISPTQIPNIVDPGPICLNSGMVTLSATPAGGLFYGTGVSGDLFDPAVAGIGAHSIYYAFVNGNGCEEKDTLDIIVWPALQDSIDADQRICEGGTAIVNAYGGLSYLWSNGATTSSIAVNPTQTTTYTVLITGLGGCSKQQSVTVLVDPLPLVSVSGATTVCLGASTQLILSGAQSYSWSPSIGVSDPISSSPVLNPLQTTVYTITAVGPNGCIASTTVTVTVISPPNVFAGNDIVSCGLPVTLTATSSSNLSYVWNNGQATSTIQVNPAQTTTYSVTGTDGNGCFASDSVTVYRPSVVMGPNQAICEGASASLSVSLTSAPASMLNLTYSWSPTAGLNDPQVSNPLASPTTTTIYTAQVTDQISGCTFSGQVVVFVIPKPVVDLGADFSVAPGSSSNLIPLVQNAGLTPSYTWSLLAPVYGSLSVSNAHNTQFLANSVVPGLVTQGLVLSVMSSSGCVATDTLNITIDPSLGGYSITGYVHYPNQAQNPVNEGFVYAYGPSGHYSVVPIGPSGIYLMNGMRDSTYTLKAKITKAWGGVTVADAQLINDNVIFSGLTGIYRGCADVTGDNRFLANDAQQTARRAADLSITNSFDDGSGPGNWFEKSSTVIVNGANINQNLLVISYGDVNASFGPALRNATTAHLSHNGQSIQDVKANELLVWPVYIDHPLSLGSYQIEFNVPEGYRIESILNELSNGYFLSNVQASHAKVLWYKTVEDAVPLFRGNLLFKLVLRKLTSSSTMNSELTLQGYQEFNDASAVPYQSVRLVSPRLSKVFGQDLLEIYPNPTQGLVHVQVKSEVSAVVSFHLLDLAGKLIRVLTKDQSLNTGLHHFDFDLSDLATGQYMIQGISDHPSLQFVKRVHVNR